MDWEVQLLLAELGLSEEDLQEDEINVLAQMRAELDRREQERSAAIVERLYAMERSW